MSRAHAWVLFALVLAPHGLEAADTRADDHVVLKSGKILTGQVTGSVRVQGTRFLKVVTDFGQILVASGEVKERVVQRGRATDLPFRIRKIRVVQWHGQVERRLAGGSPWRALDARDRYAPAGDEKDTALLAPGDGLRTGPNGSIDLMPHKDIWIRVAPNSEVEFPTGEQDATINLRQGTTIQKIRGKPRRSVYRVQTSSSVVDHVFVQGGKDSYFSLEAGRPDRTVVKEGAAKVNGLLVEAGEQTDGRGGKLPAGGAQMVLLPRHTPRFPVDDLVYVPPGTYTVGGDPFVYDAMGNKSTETNVGMRAFKIETAGYLIDRREVAANEYYDFVTAQRDRLAYGIEYPRPDEPRERWPVVGQSWESAERFARWCGKSIPTEAQWEVAAHAGKAQHQPWGGSFTRKHRELSRGTWVGNMWEPPTKLIPVDAATLDVSPFGVKGMVTNVPEWCRDDYVASPFFEHMLRSSPTQGKVARGWYAHMRLRYCVNPKSVGKFVPGFRCVVEIGPAR